MKDNARLIFGVICEFGNVAGKILEDGKVTMSDMGAALSLTDDLLALKNVNLSSLLPDLKVALNPEEFGATMAEVAAKFDIPQDEIEAKIEKSIVGIGMISGGLGVMAGAWIKK